ncbi:MAG: peptidase [Brevundimonas sp.]|uniref:peptidase n=1 Tax=Brevundimonas sp. TaxID=1871086 RepID=UPI0027348D94|nr:peptidase [Brevundimonas sp.]MDP3404382.1 peptidase [Brevundimonas sp.]
MTYCVGMMVNEGLAMIADTRTNAGVDNISSYKKLHVTQVPGERVIAIATAGNLSVTQMALSLVSKGIHMPGGDGPETLETAPSLFRAAQICGHALQQVRSEFSPSPSLSPEADALRLSASMLLGGQVRGGQLRLYLIYSLGNFIECGPDTPYMQIGELKYGKPILDRALRPETPMAEAVKLGLISFDSTIRSNIAVGPPFDMIVIPRDGLHGEQRRIEADDPYFRDLGRRWSEALANAHRAMPAPPWLEQITPPRPSISVVG